MQFSTITRLSFFSNYKMKMRTWNTIGCNSKCRFLQGVHDVTRLCGCVDLTFDSERLWSGCLRLVSQSGTAPRPRSAVWRQLPPKLVCHIASQMLCFLSTWVPVAHSHCLTATLSSSSLLPVWGTLLNAVVNFSAFSCLRRTWCPTSLQTSWHPDVCLLRAQMFLSAPYPVSPGRSVVYTAQFSNFPNHVPGPCPLLLDM